MAAFSFKEMNTVYLYNVSAEGIDFKGIKDFIIKHFGKLKVKAVKLKNPIVKTQGIIFDFLATQKAFEIVNPAKKEEACHIILTNKLFATLDEQNRPHIRSAIFGYPCVISTSGIVEGPAKPKEYYAYKQRFAPLGVWEIEEPKIKERLKGRFIDYGDKRMGEAILGLVAQGLFFYMIGDPFCKNKSCRLFNAHWQEDLINSQIKSGKFCRVHQKILTKFYLT
ncbi:MAG: DUF6775 family putative metallopeptidase [Candidatus Omnitrophota bacterium]